MLYTTEVGTSADDRQSVYECGAFRTLWTLVFEWCPDRIGMCLQLDSGRAGIVKVVAGYVERQAGLQACTKRSNPA